ncbi:MAG: hypothetical protein MK108_08080 [Mariniblastus sp.]|nr:hypothetical protein [Mariniblastus sp.]
MKIAIFSPYATVVPHFETELEIAQSHLDQGHAVEFISCYGKLANCDFNLDREPARCEDCIGRRQAGFSLLQGGIQETELATSAVDLALPRFKDLNDLRDFHVDHFDIGYAVLSSLVSASRNPEPDLEQWQPLLERLFQSSLSTYRATLDYLSASRPDRVYLFNGRFAAMRAVLRACQSHQVDCFIHERGCDQQHYDLFPNYLPHNIEAVHKSLLEYWDRDDPERETIAAQWYLDRQNRVEKNWHSFTKGQVQGRVPDTWDNDQKNITIFCSSEDEFVAVGDQWKNTIYSNQSEGIQKIVADLWKRFPDFKIYLRVHPNMKDANPQSKQKILGIRSPNLTIIPSEATIDTYEMVRQSDVVITFGSSVGIESVFWGTPSILLGPSFYQGLGGVYAPSSHSDAMALLSKTLEPGDRQAALIYGYWQQTRGIEYRFFESTGLFEGKFKDQVIYSGMKPRKSKLIQRVIDTLRGKATPA